MGPREIGGRVLTAARTRRWRAELDAPVPPLPTPAPRFTATLPVGALAAVSDEAAEQPARHRRPADGRARRVLRRGSATTWSRRTGRCDPKTGRRAPADVYAFDVPYRDEDAVGDIKQLWEPSRHQHLTVLAAAYALTGDDALRPSCRRPPEVVVGRQPADARRALDQRHRAGHPAAVVGVGPAAARRLAGRGGPVRAQPRGRAPDPRPPALAGGVPEPGLVGEQPRHRRGRGPVGRGLRVRLVPRVGAVAGRRAARRWNGSCGATRSRPGSTASWRPSTTGSCWSWAWPRWRRRRPRASRCPTRRGGCCCG